MLMLMSMKGLIVTCLMVAGALAASAAAEPATAGAEGAAATASAAAVRGGEHQQAEQARRVRRELEQFHRRAAPAAIGLIGKHLGDADPWLRFAARVALENQPLDSWRDRIDTTDGSLAAQTALLALARVGESPDQVRVLDSLAQLPWSELSGEQLLLPLRTLQLAIIRDGQPPEPLRQALLGRLDPLLPQPHFAANWLLQEVLVKLEAEAIIPRSLDLLEAATTQEEQVQYAKTLTRVSAGWDVDAATRAVVWLDSTRGLPCGKLAITAWRNLRSDFEANFPEAVREHLSDALAPLDRPVAEEPHETLAARPLVRHWTIEDLIDDVAGLQPEEHSRELGEQALAAASCLRCHRMGDRGSPTGPDLTHVSMRFDARALLESIIEPSRQVDPKYLDTAYLMNDGRVVSGRTVAVSRNQLTIETEPLSGRTVTIDRQEIEASSPSPQSPMPAQLLDTLSREEVLALIALLRR